MADERLACQRVVLAAAVSLPIFAGFATANLWIHEALRMAAVSGSAALLALAALLTVWRTRRPGWAGHLFVCGFAIQVFGEMALSGGFGAASSPLAVLIVPAAIMVGGTRGGRAWIPLVLIALGVLAMLDHAGKLPATELKETALVIDRLLSLGAGVAMAAIVVGRFAHHTDTLLATLRVERSRYRHEATHDALTGLPNRTLFLQRASDQVAASRDSGRPCSVLYLDVDGFKGINDRWGHDAGDRLLIGLARRIEGALAPGDFPARLAGDEFVVLAADCGPAGAEARRDALRRAVAGAPFDLNGPVVAVSASIGVAVFPHQAGDLDALLKMADARMYRDKSASDLRRGAAVEPVASR